MWISTREKFDRTRPAWAGYLDFIQRPSLKQVRTVDSALNACVEDCGSTRVESFVEVFEALTLLPEPNAGQYYLLYVDAEHDTLPPSSRELRLLGFDLSDHTMTSTLLNCGPWQGELAPFAERLNGYGLLTREDAEAAQALLPQAWPDHPHARANVWALYELTPPKE